MPNRKLALLQVFAFVVIGSFNPAISGNSKSLPCKAVTSDFGKIAAGAVREKVRDGGDFCLIIADETIDSGLSLFYIFENKRRAPNERLMVHIDVKSKRVLYVGKGRDSQWRLGSEE